MSLLATIRAEQDANKRAELIAALTADQLSTVKADIVTAAGEIGDDDTMENIATLTELADISDAVTERSTQLDAEKAEAAEKAKAARERIKAIEPLEGGEGEEGAEEAEGEGAESTEAVEAIAAAGKEPLRSSPARMKKFSTHAISPELSNVNENRTSLVAVGNLENHGRGDTIEGRYDLAEEMAFTLESLDRSAANGKVKIARANWADQYPESRRLSGKSLPEDFKKIDAVTSERALAASGGVCLPTNVDYSLEVWASQERPLRDGLAAFQVTRGGLVYRQPNSIGDLSDSFTEWTEATDANPGESVKNVQAISCEDPVQVYISAFVSRLQFGNLQGQFDPETIASNTDLAMAYAARASDLALLSTIQTFATNTITSASLLGASRDLFTTICQVAANFRFTNRLNRDQVLTAIFPMWGLDIIKQDRVLELGHDDSGTAIFAITDEMVNEWFMNYGVKVIWTMDGLAADAGAGTYVKQTFDAFTASSAVPAYPAKIMWDLFIEGSIQFLDGGRLDLGVVRDATLDATNDYEIFSETFENVANRSFAGGVLQIVSTTHPTGATSATVTVS